MRRYFLAIAILLACVSFPAMAQEHILGKYYIQNASPEFQGTTVVEIKLNKYRELVVTSVTIPETVAYYDEGHDELFFVVKHSAQYDVFMKIKFGKGNTLQQFSLVNYQWLEDPCVYKKKG